jgi:hypothetical protein
MRFQILAVPVVVVVMLATPAAGATITFNTDPFSGSDALTTPGRQIVGGETFITFDPSLDQFLFDSGVFGISSILFVNDVIGNVPTTGINTVVLRTFDNDANPTTPFGAGNAATLIADRVTTPGPGLFIYFNQGLDLPRLVFSTDLSASDADLKVLARMTNLTGAEGQAALATFTSANFAVASVPEPSTLSFLFGAAALLAARAGRRRFRG